MKERSEWLSWLAFKTSNLPHRRKASDPKLSDEQYGELMEGLFAEWLATHWKEREAAVVEQIADHLHARFFLNAEALVRSLRPAAARILERIRLQAKIDGSGEMTRAEVAATRDCLDLHACEDLRDEAQREVYNGWKAKLADLTRQIKEKEKSAK